MKLYERHGVVGIAFAQDGPQEPRDRIELILQLDAGGGAGIHQQGDRERLLGAAFEQRRSPAWTPLSKTVKSSLFRLPISRPAASFTVTSKRTSRTSTLKVLLRRPGTGATRPAAKRKQRELSAQNGFVPLPLDPHLAVGEVLLLPNRNQPLQPVDPLQRGLECRLAVRRRDDHGTLVSPICMRPSRCTIAMRPIAKLRAMSRPISAMVLIAMALIAFVIQEPRGAALGVVADHAFEIDEGAVLAAQNLAGDRRRFDGLAGEGEEMAPASSSDLCGSSGRSRR